MSYDLMVFDKNKAPKECADFMEWFKNKTQWNEERDYDNVDGTSEKLVKWFMEMKDTFPPMNGEYAADFEDLETPDMESYITDYCIGSDLIYMAFAWSVSDEAYEKTVELAKKYDVGFFDVSSENGDIIFWD